MSLLSVIDKLPGAAASKSCIELLEEMLERAREGEIITVGIVALKPNGDGATAYSETSNAMALIGLAHCLANRIGLGVQT